MDSPFFSAGTAQEGSLAKAKFDRRLIPPAPDFSFEAELWRQGLRWVAGIDEAGRGALAGPVAAGVILFPPEPSLAEALQGVRDSKEMTPVQRAAWAERLPGLALGWAVGFAEAQEIDTLGIAAATRLAARRALSQLPLAPEHLLIDFFRLPGCPLPQTPLVKGDARSLSIAAASILAKTARDARLVELDGQYPGYGLAVHKGYGTRLHRQALASLGPSPIHRRSFHFHHA